MFTKWQQIEDWIRDNGLTSWRFLYDKTGTSVDTDGNATQTRSNRVAVISDAFPGELDEKLALTRRRLMSEVNQTLYGYGKRGKENTGLMYCEVRLVDELQQPGTQPVSSVPAYPAFDIKELSERIRKEVKQEMELQRYEDERKNFEREKKEFEAEKASAIGMLIHHLSPVLSAMGQKRVAGLDAQEPVHAAPVQPIQTTEEDVEMFTENEADALFDLMARFKAVEPRYMELIERVVVMAESGDGTYEMAKGFLLK